VTNGSNDWGVSFSRIAWLDKVLCTNNNIASVARHDDIVFELERRAQKDRLRLICCDEYSLGMLVVQRALDEFSPLHIIYTGGSWSGYTPEAKEYCLDAKIGLFNSTELNGALRQADYWSFHRTDEDGNPVYCYKAA
jgi:hypothetical protein